MRTRLLVVGFVVTGLAVALGAACEGAPTVGADVASVSKAVRQHMGAVKKCWKLTPERFVSATQTLRFDVKDGRSRVSFSNPAEDAHPLGECIKKKLSVIRFEKTVTATIELPVRLTERAVTPPSGATPPQPTSAPATRPAVGDAADATEE